MGLNQQKNINGSSNPIVGNPTKMISSDTIKNRKKLEKENIETIQKVVKDMNKNEDKNNKLSSILDYMKKQLHISEKNLKINDELLEEEKESEKRVEEEKKKSFAAKAKLKISQKKDQIKESLNNKKEELITKVKESKGNTLGMIGSILKLVLGGAALITLFGPQIKEAMGSFITWIKNRLPSLASSVWESIKELGSKTIDNIKKYGPVVLEGVWSGLKTLGSFALDSITKYGPVLTSMLWNGLKNLGEFVIDGVIKYGPKLLTSVGESLSGIATSLKQSIITYTPIIIEILGDELSELGTNIKREASLIVNKIWTSVESGFDSIGILVKNKVISVFENISDFIARHTNNMFGTIKMTDDEKDEFINKLNKIDINTNKLQDEMRNLGVTDSTLWGKDEIEDENKLRLMSIKLLNKLLDSDFIKDEEKKKIKNILDEKKEKEKQNNNKINKLKNPNKLSDFSDGLDSSNNSKYSKENNEFRHLNKHKQIVLTSKKDNLNNIAIKKNNNINFKRDDSKVVFDSRGTKRVDKKIKYDIGDRGRNMARQISPKKETPKKEEKQNNIILNTSQTNLPTHNLNNTKLDEGELALIGNIL